MSCKSGNVLSANSRSPYDGKNGCSSLMRGLRQPEQSALRVLDRIAHFLDGLTIGNGRHELRIKHTMRLKHTCTKHSPVGRHDARSERVAGYRSMEGSWIGLARDGGSPLKALPAFPWLTTEDVAAWPNVNP